MRILLGVHYRKPSIAGHVKGGPDWFTEAEQSRGRTESGAVRDCLPKPRSTCYPSSPCPLSLEPVLPEPHPRATISGCQDSKGKSQQKSEGREQREAKVFIPLAAPQGHPGLGVSLILRPCFSLGDSLLAGSGNYSPLHPCGPRSGNSSP